MKKELYKKEISYALSLAFIDGLLKNELLTPDEFRCVQQKLRKKYKPFLRYKLENIA